MQHSLAIQAVLIAMLNLAVTACTTNPHSGQRQPSDSGKSTAIGAAALDAVTGVLIHDSADKRC